MKKILIYTDGACRGNPGPGGWGALLRYGQQEKRISGAEKLTTNNRMELMAALQALYVIRRGSVIEIYTDSQYLQKGISEWLPVWKKRGWKTANKKPVKNADLWEKLEQEVARHQIVWHWIRGHSNHPENDLADQLANEAIDAMMR